MNILNRIDNVVKEVERKAQQKNQELNRRWAEALAKTVKNMMSSNQFKEINVGLYQSKK